MVVAEILAERFAGATLGAETPCGTVFAVGTLGAVFAVGALRTVAIAAAVVVGVALGTVLAISAARTVFSVGTLRTVAIAAARTLFGGIALGGIAVIDSFRLAGMRPVRIAGNPWPSRPGRLRCCGISAFFLVFHKMRLAHASNLID
jgi:hypothetical protein